MKRRFGGGLISWLLLSAPKLLTRKYIRVRLRSLYSDFRQLRHINPDGYNANISAWQTALSNGVRQGLCPAVGGAESDLLILRTSDQLLEALETKDLGRPLSLGTVAVCGCHSTICIWDVICLHLR